MTVNNGVFDMFPVILAVLVLSSFLGRLAKKQVCKQIHNNGQLHERLSDESWYSGDYFQGLLAHADTEDSA